MLKIFFPILIVLCNFIVKAQNKVNINLGYGYFIVNSENSLKLMEDDKYHFFMLYNINYENSDLFGCDLIFEYSYQQITKKDIIQFFIYSPTSPSPISPPIPGNMKLITHNLDFDFKAKIANYFSVGIGPSFIIVNRVFEIENLFYDKLASSGLGVNGFLEFSIPLNKSKNYFFFNSKLKFRYTHSIWFDKGKRNLDNYGQDFFTVQILAGIGYAF